MNWGRLITEVAPGSGVDWNITLTLAAVLVAVIAVPVAVLATRKWGNRRAVVTWFAESVSLLPAQSGRALLEMTYRDIPVNDPVLVTVSFANTGPRDLASSMFDNARPITVQLGVTFYGLTQTEGAPSILSPAVGTPPTSAQIEFHPKLLKRRESWSFSAVVSGAPEVKVSAPLVDTEVKRMVHIEPGSKDDLFSITVDTMFEVLSVLFPLQRKKRI